MTTSHTDHIPLALHGLAVEVRSDVPALGQGLRRMFHAFVSAWPPGFTPIIGQIRPYEQAEVIRCLSPQAQQIAVPNNAMEIYADGERFWVVDDRWGLAEINLLKGQWRSWVLPQPRLDYVRCIEQAILWPMAQLLRAKGLHLLPAASLAWSGRGMLILSPFNMEPELSAMLGAGYRVIGQRWTALREEDGRIALLHLPGRVERHLSPRMRLTSHADRTNWIDLLKEHPLAGQHHAFCEAVLIVEPGRRHAAQVVSMTADVLSSLRAAWPILELHPTRHHPHGPTRLATSTRTFELTLSRNPQDLLRAMYDVHYGASATPQIDASLPRPTRPVRAAV